MKKFLLTIIGVTALIGIILALVSYISGKKSENDVDNETELVEYVTVNMTTEATTEKASVTDEVYVPVDDTSFSTATDPDYLIREIEAGNTGNQDDGSGNGSGSSEPYTPQQKTEDTDRPIFLINSKAATIKKGTNFDIHSLIGYGDDVDRDVDLKVDGDVDTSTVGSYNLTLTLTDDAGHTNSSPFLVRVVEGGGGIDSGTQAQGTVSFKEFTETYREDNTSFGLDVSRWQGSIDFNKVKAAGCDFVIIRLGGYDDGEHYTDRYYTENIKNAKAAGLKVGIYWHAEESTTDEAEMSVAYLMNILGGETLDFPIAYDWEDFLGFEKYHMNLQDINDCFEAFASAAEAKGYEVCLYSSKNFLENVWVNSRDHKVWLAHYTSHTDYRGKYYMWQQSSSGKIDGISTAVDFNILYQ